MARTKNVHRGGKKPSSGLGGGIQKRTRQTYRSKAARTELTRRSKLQAQKAPRKSPAGLTALKPKRRFRPRSKLL